MDNLLHISLRAVRRKIGLDRVYRISLGTDLFHTWFVTVTFGRRNTVGTSQTKYFVGMKEACQFIDRVLKKRLSAPGRIGCPYQMVRFSGKEDVLGSISQNIIDKFTKFEDANRLLQDRKGNTYMAHPLKSSKPKGFRRSFDPNHPVLPLITRHNGN